MIRLPLLLVASFLFSSAAQQPAPADTVAGRVVRADNNEPVSGAQIHLLPLAGEPGTLATQVFAETTNEKGEFRYKDIAPGKYWLSAEADGFALQQYSFESGVGRDDAKLVFRLVGTGSVSGRVVSAAGPVQGLEVTLIRPAYDSNAHKTYSGASAFRSVGSGAIVQNTGIARTNDRGEFRLYGIPPGRYFLIVSAPATADVRLGTVVSQDPRTRLNAVEQFRRFETAFYPGTSDVSKASWLEMEPGRELSGIDVVVREQATYRVRGRVVDESTGQTPDQTAGFVSLSVFPRTPLPATGSQFSNRPMPDGTFELANVPAGPHVLVALLQPLPNRVAQGQPLPLEPPARLARLDIDVLNMDLENVLVSFAPLARIAGKYNLDGKVINNLPGFDQIRAVFVPTGNATRVAIPARLIREHSSSQPDGAFLYDGVVPGEYDLRFNGLPSNVYVRDARYGNADVLTKPIRISSGNPDVLTITVSDKAGQIEGKIEDWATRQGVTTEVTLIPNQNRDLPGFYRSTSVDGSGHFKLGSIPPGDYKLFAWDDIRYEYFDPDFLRRVEDKGVPVVVRESSRETVDLRLINR
jgi:hypothetical protein